MLEFLNIDMNTRDQVWAVTVGGRVLYRQGVTSSCPEGVGWLSVPTHTNREVSQVSGDRQQQLAVEQQYKVQHSST